MSESTVTLAEVQVAANRDEISVEEWICERMSDLLDMESDEVDVHRPVAAYGIDSVDAAYLVGDLEEWMGRKIPPDFVWEWSTVREIAKRLAEASTA